MLLANLLPPVSHQTDGVVPFRYSYSTQVKLLMFKACCIATMSVSWPNKNVHFRAQLSTSLVLRSNKLSILCSLLLLAMKALLPDIAKCQYQLDQCSRLRQSSSVKPAGRGRPRNRFTAALSQQLTKVQSVALGSEKLNIVDSLFKKGKQVVFISWTVSLLISKFCSVYLAQLGQLIRMAFSLVLILMGWCALGRAQFCSSMSVLLLQGGSLKYLSMKAILGPVPAGYIPQNMACALCIVLLVGVEYISNSVALNPAPTNPIPSTYYFLSSCPSL